MIKIIAFDADDTLWHNEPIFISTKEKLKRLLSGFPVEDLLEQRLDEAETRNIEHFGCGIKGFTLSMIETACEITKNKVTGKEISQIVGFAREMLASPVELLEDVEATVRELSGKYDLMLVTKGDLFDRETRLARSGLGAYFKHVETVSNKDAPTCRNILRRHKIRPAEFVMVGNSLRSDILPVLETGAKAVHIEYESEWFHEKVPDEELQGRDFVKLKRMSELAGWIKMNNF